MTAPRLIKQKLYNTHIKVIQVPLYQIPINKIIQSCSDIHYTTIGVYVQTQVINVVRSFFSFRSLAINYKNSLFFVLTALTAQYRSRNSTSTKTLHDRLSRRKIRYVSIRIEDLGGRYTFRYGIHNIARRVTFDTLRCLSRKSRYTIIPL